MKNAKPHRHLSPAAAGPPSQAPGNNGQEEVQGKHKARQRPTRNGRDFRIIVLGASAGGVEALTRVVKTLPPNLPAAVFVVLHISPTGPSLLPDILTRAGRLPALHPEDGEEIVPGNIYVAPPDRHLLIKPGRVIVSRGPRENNARPAVDPLFRTAARSYGPWVVGVILSGGLDDGTLGLMDVKAYSGITIVQNPDEAMFPSMPNSAIENVQVDRVASLDEIGPLLARLAREPVPEEQGAAFMARNQTNDPDVAEVGSDDLKTGNITGPPSKFTCPECGGALWEIQNGKLLRYRCHIGHGYTAETLMVAQGEKLEDALWSALRALEEIAGMRRRMANRARSGGWDIMARNYAEQAALAETRAGVVRSVLVDDKPQNVTANSAKARETQAAETIDWNAGAALVGNPESLQPSGEFTPPDPSAVNSGVQSGASRAPGKGRSSSSRKFPGAKGKSVRRIKSDRVG